MSESWERTDGVVTIRPPRFGDAALLVAGRDVEFHRFLGPGADDPDPVACIVIDGDVVGWVDHDAERPWLLAGEVNVGYHVFASHRGCGIASRAVQLLMHHLAVTGQCRTATLLIHPDNVRSQALAERTRFVRQADLDGHPYYKRPVPPLTYRDRGVTIRRRRVDDLTMDLAGRDDEHIRWLWRAGERDRWEAMIPSERRAHVLEWLTGASDTFGTGPRWTFSVDLDDAASVGGIEVGLVSDHAPPGDANVSYWVHPAFRRRGIASIAVEQALQFLRDHTGASRAHLMVDPGNVASLGVARAVGATVGAVTVDRDGHSLIRHSFEV